MATNTELKIAELLARIEVLEAAGLSKEKIIFQVSKEQTTQKVSDLIRTAYDNISQAIVDAKRDGNIEAIPALNQLKKDVPKKWAISKQSMVDLNNLLNSLVGSSVQ